MRISLIGPVYPYRGGISHYTAALAQSLQSAGDEIQMISFHRQYPGWLYPGESDKDPSQMHVEMPAQFLLDPLYPWTWITTANKIIKFNPDRVVIAWWTTFWGPCFSYLCWVLKTNKIDVIFQIHNVLPHEQRFFDRFLARFTLGQASGYIVHSQREQTRFQTLLPQASRMQNCGLPLLTQMNIEGQSKSEARKNLNLPENALVLLFFGIIRPYKGLSYLVDAVALLRQSNIDVHALIVGEFWDNQANYENQIERLNLADRVHVVARYVPNEEVGKYFTATDIFVAPHIEGSQSGAYKVALAFGIPIVMTSAIAENEANEWTRIVPPANPAAIANAVLDLRLTKFNIPPAPAYGWDDLVTTIHQI